jgi:hypothetical protein
MGEVMSDELSDEVRRALWEINILTGADTDGDGTWHCSGQDAIRFTIDAVRQLRADYDSACDRLPVDPSPCPRIDPETRRIVRRAIDSLDLRGFGRS